MDKPYSIKFDGKQVTQEEWDALLRNHIYDSFMITGNVGVEIVKSPDGKVVDLIPKYNV